MTYEFPPPVPMSISVSAFAAYLLFFTFALVAIFRVFAWHERRPDKSLLRWSCGALGVAAAIAAAGLIHPQTRGRLHQYLGFFAIVFGTLATLTLIRQVLKRRPSTIWTALTLVVGILIATTISGLPPPFSGDGLRSGPGCPSNLRILQLSHLNAASSHDGRLPEAVDAHGGVPTSSWRLDMLDYMEREFDKEGYGISTADAYAFNEAWDAPANLTVARVLKRQYFCTSNLFPTDDSGRYFTNYARITGPETAFPVGKRTTLDAIAEGDGLTQTILLGECSGLNIVWTEPRDIDTAKLKIGINLPGERPRTSSSILSSYHPGGAFVVFADGRVQFLSEKIDPNVLKALTTATGGEHVPDDIEP